MLEAWIRKYCGEIQSKILSWFSACLLWIWGKRQTRGDQKPPNQIFKWIEEPVRNYTCVTKSWEFVAHLLNVNMTKLYNPRGPWITLLKGYENIYYLWTVNFYRHSITRHFQWCQIAQNHGKEALQNSKSSLSILKSSLPLPLVISTRQNKIRKRISNDIPLTFCKTPARIGSTYN